MKLNRQIQKLRIKELGIKIKSTNIKGKENIISQYLRQLYSK